MHNTLSRPTYRRWAIFYAAAAALLAGWLLLEKMPDGREELAVSVEETFRGSGEVMERNNKQLLQETHDRAEEYFSPQSIEYQNRLEKVLALATSFEYRYNEDGVAQRLVMLRDSLVQIADSTTWNLPAASEITERLMTTKPKSFDKILIKSQLFTQSKMLVNQTAAYCARATTPTCVLKFDKWMPGFLPHTSAPRVGEALQAEVFLTRLGWVCDGPPHYITTCFLNDHPIPIKDGTASIRTTFPTPGPHTLRLRFRRERFRDGSVTEVSRDFTVNVLERCNPND